MERKKAIKKAMSTVFVGSIPKELSPEEIVEVMTDCGRVSSFNVVDKDVHLVFEEPESAMKAIKEFNNCELAADCAPLKVELKK